MLRNSIAPLLIALSFLISGCGPSDAPDANRTEGDPTTQTTDAAPDGQRGNGTLQLGDTTYEFNVRVCDTSGDSDDDYQTLVGRGSTPEGDTFDVFVSRNIVSGMVSHSVSFQSGDVRSPEGTVIEANRINMGGAWTSMHQEADEPLVQVAGGRITASGMFTNENTEESVQGRLEATCRS
ncbi:hypothetical protein BH23ACT11_BH23ACT11_04400 [soil metagenome]